MAIAKTESVELTIEQRLAKLREPFPPEVIGKLPKVTCADCIDKRITCSQHKKAKCKVCGACVSTAHIHLDFVGHADATDRLLTVDPEWSWEPYSFDGGPALRPSVTGRELNLWITLTVCGVSRIGVGSVANTDKAFDAEKQLIGDAIRNASMRFGLALDLWAKSDLESSLVVEESTAATSSETPGTKAVSRPPKTSKVDPETGEIVPNVDAAKLADILGALESIEPQPARAQAKQKFASQYGAPNQVDAESIDAALTFAKGLFDASLSPTEEKQVA
jgi:hypothetical protein